MSGRRAQSLPPHMLEPIKPERGRCVAAICFSWKVLTCIVSHVILVLLVVSYCVGGAYLFQHLEKPHEIEVKKGIHNMRLNLTEKIWRFSDNELVLSEGDWMASVKMDLANFENQILTAMKANGWDGNEDITKSQWTFAGSLFYSIIVITTIGYGHISPRTDWGKVTTIFYAIVGIPLMLLCLSNIGDVMATSFRFIYWRVCCYVCTRTTKRPKSRSRQRSMRHHRYVSRSQPPPMRRSMRLTQRSTNDSGFGPSIDMPHAYSDPELRSGAHGDYNRSLRSGAGRGAQRQNQQLEPRGGRHSNYLDETHMDAQTFNHNTRYSSRQRNREHIQERHTVERERYVSRSKHYMIDERYATDDMHTPAKRTMSVRSMRTPVMQATLPTHGVQQSRASRELNRLNSQQVRGRSVPNTPQVRDKSVDPRAQYEQVDEEVARKTPIISNRYAVDDFEPINSGHSYHGRGGAKHALRSQSMPRTQHQRMHNNFNNGNRSHNAYIPQGRRSSLGRQPSRYGNQLELPEYTVSHLNHITRGRSPQIYNDYEEDIDDSFVEDEFEHANEYAARAQSSPRRKQRKPRRERAERLPPSPRIMSPMGFPVQRQIRRRPSYDYDDDSIYGDDGSDYYGDLSPKDRPVPIWLCVFLVISYILGGAALFAYWEKWSFLDSAYFCFITLTTIGFGDFVPAKGVKDESEQSIAYCSLYLLFGIALLAMSFNLVQEEFIANVKEVARRLGILKDEEEDI